MKFVKIIRSNSTSELELRINGIINEYSMDAELKNIEFSSFTKDSSQHLLALLTFEENK